MNMQYGDITVRIDTIRNLHQNSDRDRIRAVMNGGAAGIQAVLAWDDGHPGQEAAALGIDLPTANVMWSGLEKLAQRIGRAPTLKTDMVPHRDTEKARQAAEKRHRIVSGWDEMSRMEMQYPQIGRWLPGYGFTMHVIKEQKYGDAVYPVAELRDPFDVYPGWFGANQQPIECVSVRMVPRDYLSKIYPDYTGPKRKRLPGGGVALQGTGRWEGNGGETEVVEYINPDGTYIVCYESEQVLDFIPNPLESGPAFVISKRFAFDELKSQYTHTFGLMAMMAKLNLLGLIGAEDSTFRETNIFGEMNSNEYEKGRDSINFLEVGSRVEKPTGDQVNQTWQAINILERQFRIVAGYDVQQDGASPNSWATGAGMEELQGAADNNVREYQTVIRHSMELVDRKRLEWEDTMHPSESKRVFWYEGSEAFEETYKAKDDIAGDYRTRRIYGAMATFDETSKLLAGLQLLGARVIDRRTLQENLDGFENISLINERIDQDMAKEQLIGSLGMRAQQMDPAATMALVEIMDVPGETTETLKKLFTPQEPQMSPEEQAMAAGGGGMAGALPGGGAEAAVDPIQTILSRIEAEGGGAQTVAMNQ